MGTKNDLTGKRYGRLVVLFKNGKTKSGNSRWDCICDCGNQTNVIGSLLVNGETQSCGCFRVEASRERGTTHNMSRHRLYHIWNGMQERCYRATNPAYPNYGGRGIGVCDEWRSNFEAFRDWALSSGYADDLTIERDNNNGYYSPDNCRWATMKEQSNNRRSNIIFEINGVSKNATQWAQVYGVNPKRLHEALRSGQTIFQSLGIEQ